MVLLNTSLHAWLRRQKIHVGLCWGYPDIPAHIDFRSRCAKHLIALALPLLVGGGKAGRHTHTHTRILLLSRWKNRQWWSLRNLKIRWYFRSVQTVRICFYFCNPLITIGRTKNCCLFWRAHVDVVLVSWWYLACEIWQDTSAPFFRVSVAQ